MFARLVMGHKTASAQFSRVMEKLWRNTPFKNLLHFVDDMLLSSNTIKDHLFRLEYVLKTLKSAGLKLAPDKCRLFQNKVNFVGLSISENGIEIDSDRVKAITELQPPTSVKFLQKILGVFGYNRKFIANYATITAPLYNLLKKNVTWDWSDDCQSAFEKLKKIISTAPVLALPDTSDPHNSYELSCDSSFRGFGGVLTQLINGKRRTIGYFSKAVPSHQRHWPAVKLEFTGLHACLMHWKLYLMGARKVKVFVDCKALLSLDKIFSRSNAAMQRKLADIQGFNLVVSHISGVSNVVADVLSRYPFENSSKSKSTQTEISNDTCKIQAIADNKIFPITLNEIKNGQNLDLALRELKSWLVEGKKPDNVQQIGAPENIIYYWKQFSRFVLSDDIIRYKWHTPTGDILLTVVPESMYEKKITNFHSNIAVSHPGIENSVAACREKYWFRDMHKEFQLYVSSCRTCQEAKQAKQNLKGPLQPIISRSFGEVISIDHLIPSMSIVTPNKNRFILTITCLFSGYLVAVPVKSQKSEETIKAIIEKWFCVFGLPQKIIHDLHANFTSELFTAVTKIFGIKDCKTTGFKSSTNGKCEAQNKRINGAMRTALSPDQYKNWDRWLPFIVLALNSLKSSRTGVSANFLLFGRNLRAPQDLFSEEIEPIKYE